MPTRVASHDVVDRRRRRRGARGGVASRPRLRRLRVLELEPVAGGTARREHAREPLSVGRALRPRAAAARTARSIALLGEMGVLEGTTRRAVARAVPLPRARGAHLLPRPLVRGALPRTPARAPTTCAQLARVRARDRALGRRGATRRAGARSRSRSRSARDDAEVLALDRISMAQWLDAHASRRRACAGSSTTPAATTTARCLGDTSAWAGIFYFASRVRGAGEAERAGDHLARGQRPARRAPRASRARVDTGWLVHVASIADARRGVDVVALVARRPPAARHPREATSIFAAPQFIAARVIRGFDSRPRASSSTARGWWRTSPARPAAVERLPARVGQRALREPVARLRRRHAPARRRHGPTVFTYYYPLCDPDPRAARERLLSAGPRRVGRGRARRSVARASNSSRRRGVSTS